MDEIPKMDILKEYITQYYTWGKSHAISCLEHTNLCSGC